MSIITAKGKQAKESANKPTQTIDFKKVFIKLKGGDSIRVRLLSDEDYIEYLAHGSYAKGIHTQPCIEVAGDKCAICEASKYEGGEKDANGNPEFKHLGRKKRYLLAFADLDENMIRFFDATKKQAQGIIGTIDEYAENIGDIAFTLKRTGSGKDDTSYSLNPILKLKPEDHKKFEAFNGKEADAELFETVLQARSREDQLKELQKGGFPVKEVFGVDINTEIKEEGDNAEGEKPIDINPDDLPF